MKCRENYTNIGERACKGLADNLILALDSGVQRRAGTQFDAPLVSQRVSLANELHRCTADHLAPGLWEGITVLDEMLAHMTETGGPVTRATLSNRPDWLHFLKENVRQVGHGVYAVRYLSEAYCAALLRHLRLFTYEVNTQEPESAQIPEVTLEDNDPKAFEVLRGLWSGYMHKLVAVLFHIESGECQSIQAARYTPENTPHGCWHLDDDSEITLVVALSNDHEGGGTEVYNGPFTFTTTVPQLEVGWGMLFNGRSRLHMGLPVHKGTRNLLVHWYNQSKDADE